MAIEFSVSKRARGFIVYIQDEYASSTRVHEVVVSDKDGLTMGQAQEYMAALGRHIKGVRSAGERLGVNWKQLAVHDLSKYDPEEFIPYARHFYGDRGDRQGYVHAWLRHLHLNPHHWQYWIFPDGYSPEDADVVQGAVQMPERYLYEMVADWMGASLAYTGSEDMTDWLKDNMNRIHLHPETAEALRDILAMLGYSEAIYGQPFKHESG